MQQCQFKSVLARPRDEVMDISRLGVMHQTRLSFSRSLIRTIAKQKWRLELHAWTLDDNGFGRVVYQLETPSNTYSMAIFCDQIADEERNDRVIAEKWDVTFALVEGVLSNVELDQLYTSVPLQEAGRNHSRVLVLARANKSVRVFDHVLERLATGQQPDSSVLEEVGYLLRTTAVYGNGKFGIADFSALSDNPDFNQSFRAQLCAVYLLRHFSVEWINYIAKQRGGARSQPLALENQRYLGVGNATGLGMAPYLIKQPLVVNHWLSQRERAVTQVLADTANADQQKALAILLQRAATHLRYVVTVDQQQAVNNQQTVSAIELLLLRLQDLSVLRTWFDFYQAARNLGLESQEVLLSCLLELYPEHCDDLAELMNHSEAMGLDARLSVAQCLQQLSEHYHWALAIDFNQPEAQYWFWYRSADKEEPRLGVRALENGVDREMRIDIARQVQQYHRQLTCFDQDKTLAAFLLQYPEFRSIASRCQTLQQQALGDIQVNSLAENFYPIDLLRCKLSMLGATKFDPRSDRWVRVTFFQGAPIFGQPEDGAAVFPVLHECTTAGPRVTISLNEISTTVNKVAEGFYRRCGEPERLADAVACLELFDLGGIRRLAEGIDYLACDDDFVVVLKDQEQSSNPYYSADFQACSVIYQLPQLLDVINPQCGEYSQLVLENCRNRWFVVGELLRLAKLGVAVRAQWFDKDQKVMLDFAQGAVAPSLQLQVLDQVVDDFQLQIEFNPRDTISSDPENGYIEAAALAHCYQNRLKKGSSVLVSDWHKVKSYVSNILVENSLQSAQGAGAQSDRHSQD